MELTQKNGSYPEELTQEMIDDVKDKLGTDEFLYAKTNCTIFENADDPTEKAYIIVNEENPDNSTVLKVSSNNPQAFIQAIEIELGCKVNKH